MAKIRRRTNGQTDSFPDMRKSVKIEKAIYWKMMVAKYLQLYIRNLADSKHAIFIRPNMLLKHTSYFNFGPKSLARKYYSLEFVIHVEI